MYVCVPPDLLEVSKLAQSDVVGPPVNTRYDGDESVQINKSRDVRGDNRLGRCTSFSGSEVPGESLSEPVV